MSPMEEDSRNSVLSQLVDSVKAISELPECRNVFRKISGDLVRRVKLLSPLFEELRDGDEAIGEEEMKSLESLRIALDSTMELLNSVNHGSKIYQFGHGSRSGVAIIVVVFFSNGCVVAMDLLGIEAIPAPSGQVDAARAA